MTRRGCLSLILGVLLATANVAFAPTPVYCEPPKKPDLLDTMQGTWEVQEDDLFVAPGTVIEPHPAADPHPQHFPGLGLR